MIRFSLAKIIKKRECSIGYINQITGCSISDINLHLPFNPTACYIRFINYKLWQRQKPTTSMQLVFNNTFFEALDLQYRKHPRTVKWPSLIRIHAYGLWIIELLASSIQDKPRNYYTSLHPPVHFPLQSGSRLIKGMPTGAVWFEVCHKGFEWSAALGLLVALGEAYPHSTYKNWNMKDEFNGKDLKHKQPLCKTNESHILW